MWQILLDRGKRPKYTCHGRFTQQFLESQPGYRASFTVTGGFLNAVTRSLKKVTGRIFKYYLVSVFKEAIKNLAFGFLSNKDEQNFKNHKRIYRNYLFNFISWHSPFKYGDATTVVPPPLPPSLLLPHRHCWGCTCLLYIFLSVIPTMLNCYCWEAKQLQSMPHSLPETRMLICCHLIIRSSIYINTGTHNSLISGFPNKQ